MNVSECADAGSGARGPTPPRRALRYANTAARQKPALTPPISPRCSSNGNHSRFRWENPVICLIIVSMGRRIPKARATQHRLKAAAADVFTTRGYGVTGVDHIVEQAGTTRGAFYYYFASKADVARDIQEDLWSGAARQSEAVVDPEADFLTNVRYGLEAYLAALKDLGPERAFLCEGFAETSLAMFEGQGQKWGTHFVRERLIAAMDKGEIPRQDIEDATVLLVEALQALTLAALKGDDVSDALKVIDDLNRALLLAVPNDVGVRPHLLGR
jgi:AcrR family transcriptional regulator